MLFTNSSDSVVMTLILAVVLAHYLCLDHHLYISNYFGDPSFFFFYEFVKLFHDGYVDFLFGSFTISDRNRFLLSCACNVDSFVFLKVFIDEFDAIALSREDGGEDLSSRMVVTLSQLMDEIKRIDHLLVIAATNRPDSIDPALRRPGRLDQEIEIGSHATSLFSYFFKKLFISCNSLYLTCNSLYLSLLWEH